MVWCGLVSCQVMYVFPLLAALEIFLDVPQFLNVARVVTVFARLLESLSPIGKTYIKNHGEYMGVQRDGKPVEPGLIATRTEEYERHDQRPM